MFRFGYFNRYRFRFEENVRRLRPFMFILITVAFIAQAFYDTKTTDMFWHGFGVDSAGRVYVGHHNTILVYESGKKTHTLPICELSSYVLTIVDDQIRIAGDQKKLVYNLDGVLQSTHTDPDDKLYEVLKNKTYTTSNGKSYKAQNIMGFYWITDSGGQIVYRRPIADSLTSLFFLVISPLSLVSLLILGFALPAPSKKTDSEKTVQA